MHQENWKWLFSSSFLVCIHGRVRLRLSRPVGNLEDFGSAGASPSGFENSSFEATDLVTRNVTEGERSNDLRIRKSANRSPLLTRQVTVTESRHFCELGKPRSVVS